MKTLAALRTRISTLVTTFHKYSPGFRRKLQINLIGATLSILLLVIWGEAALYRAVKRNIALGRGQQLQQQSEKPFKLLAQYVVDTSLNQVRQQGKGGKIDLSDFRSASRQMLFALTKAPVKATLQIADEDGRELLMFESGMGWQARQVLDGNRAEWKHWEGGEVVDGGWRSFEYDPRHQDWYLAATTEDIAWIIPAKMPESREPPSSMSASLAWEFAGKRYVAALHIPLKEVLTLVRLFSGNEQGIMFGPFESGEFVVANELYNSELNNGLQRDEALLVKMKTVPSETEAQAVVAGFMEQWRQWNESRKESIANITIGGTQWWIGVKRITLGRQHFWLGIAFPEHSVLSAIQREQKTMVSILISTTILALIVLGIQLRFFLRTSEEIEQEYIQSQERKQSILKLIERGESSRLEFKSTIRWNLKTNKAGKEIEIAWLKTVVAYLNSEGGMILLGVRDDGEVLGLEADCFQNEDRLLLHVNNLLKQHVGLEFVQFIEVELHHVEERQVLGIRCTPSKAPAFLKHHKDEQFYIRTGPSSLRLSGSEMLKYLNQQGSKR